MNRTAVALIDEPRCIGCARCIEACPVDCIDMVPPPGRWAEADARGAKQRAAFRRKRICAEKPKTTPSDRKAVIAAILKRKRAK